METLFIGRNLIFLPLVNSTNSYAIEMLKNVNPAEGTVVYTAEQTSGRGQRGSAWNAERASNLTASVIIRPVFLNLKNQHYLYKISALTCYDVLAEILDTSQFDIKIKWPNDILVNRRKIAGVLIENNITGSQLSWSVVGVGLNINQAVFDELFNATSLKILSNRNYTVDDILQAFCRHFEKYYLQLKSNKLSAIKEQYLKHFFRLNNWMDFEIEGITKTMYVLGVSDEGMLWLKDKNDRSYFMDVKQVKWIY